MRQMSNRRSQGSAGHYDIRRKEESKKLEALEKSSMSGSRELKPGDSWNNLEHGTDGTRWHGWNTMRTEGKLLDPFMEHIVNQIKGWAPGITFHQKKTARGNLIKAIIFWIFSYERVSSTSIFLCHIQFKADFLIQRFGRNATPSECTYARWPRNIW